MGYPGHRRPAVVTERFYTTSTAFLEALAEAGVQYIFANLGSDHPGLIEALAQARAEGSDKDLPRLIVCPHEMVALSAAHAVRRWSPAQPQAVIVHVDAGTQNMGGAISNALRGRVAGAGLRRAPPRTRWRASCPAAATSSSTGSRTCPTSAASCAATSSTTTRSAPGSNVKQLVHRALQIAAQRARRPGLPGRPARGHGGAARALHRQPGRLPAGRAGGAHRGGRGRDRQRARRPPATR